MKKRTDLILSFLVLFVSLSAICPAEEPPGGFSMKIHGGLSYVKGGDLDSGQAGWAGFYKVILGLLSYSPQGGYQPVELGMNVGAEFLFRLHPSLGVGLGLGFMQALSSTDISFSPALAGLEALTYEAKTRMSAVPIGFNVYYFFVSKGRLTLNVHGGLAPYLAWGYASQRMADSAGNWTLNEYDVRGGGMGFEGGLGLEFKINRRLDLFADVRARLASFANFKGDVAMSDSSGWSDSASGLMWNERVDLGSLGSLEIFEISETEPIGSGISDVRRTRIDFSGLSLVFGLIFRL